MKKESKFKNWFKKYGTYATAGAIVCVLATAILVTGLNSGAQSANTKSNVNNAVVSVNTTPISFSMPMSNASLIKDYSNEELYFNNTLGRWEFHDGIDLTSNDLKVFAVADGEVENVTQNSLEGTVVTIKHANNLRSVYSSLSNDLLVEKGDKVKAGDQIGNADNSASNENSDGKHLHFSMLDNGKKIDPANYLEIEVK